MLVFGIGFVIGIIVCFGFEDFVEVIVVDFYIFMVLILLMVCGIYVVMVININGFVIFQDVFCIYEFVDVQSIVLFVFLFVGGIEVILNGIGFVDFMSMILGSQFIVGIFNGDEIEFVFIVFVVLFLIEGVVDFYV